MANRFRDKIAFAADIATLGGISLLGVLVPYVIPYLSDRPLDVTDLIISITFYLLMLSCVVLFCSYLLVRIAAHASFLLSSPRDITGHDFATRSMQLLFLIVAMMFFLATFTYYFGTMKDKWASEFNDRYFYPEKPENVFESIEFDLRQPVFSTNGDMSAPTCVGKFFGHVSFKKNKQIGSNQYDANLYLKGDSEFTTNTNFGHESTANIEEDGTFSGDFILFLKDSKDCPQINGLIVITYRFDQKRIPYKIYSIKNRNLMRLDALIKL